MAYKATPLNSGFMVFALLVLIFAVFYIPKYSESWAFAFGFLAVIMLISSFISMSRATPDEQLSPRPKPVK